MLEIPPEWNAVTDLIMEDKEGMMITKTDSKWKRDKVAQGKEETAEERRYPPIETQTFTHGILGTQNPAGFYSEDLDEIQQEEDEWQIPDKWQRFSQMVFCGGGLEINPNEAGCISSSCTQHQGGGCSVSVAYRR